MVGGSGFGGQVTTTSRTPSELLTRPWLARVIGTSCRAVHRSPLLDTYTKGARSCAGGSTARFARMEAPCASPTSARRSLFTTSSAE
jgi:hypothetical protein